MKVDAEPRPRRYGPNLGVGADFGEGGQNAGRGGSPRAPPPFQDLPTPRAGRGIRVTAQSEVPHDAAVQEVDAGLGEGGCRGGGGWGVADPM